MTNKILNALQSVETCSDYFSSIATKSFIKNKLFMPINQALLAEFKHESNNTRKILERIPTDKLTWKPHEKSMTLGRLATHIAEIPIWIDRTITQSEFDFATFVFKRETKESTEAILQLFEERKESAIKLVESASDEDLNALYTLRRGEHILVTAPKKSKHQERWL